MNLENLGLVELNAQEVESIDGGHISIIWVNWEGVGSVLKNSAMATLGLFAGIGDGIRAGMN